MIRHSWPEDTPAIQRLAIAQYQRTPWSLDGSFAIAHTFHVCERRGHIAACLGYRRDDDRTLRVMHVWAEDGFGGRRAAVELMLDMEAFADATEMDLVFDTMPSNVGLRAGVEEHYCEVRSLHEQAVEYRRKAKVLSWADRP